MTQDEYIEELKSTINTIGTRIRVIWEQTIEFENENGYIDQKFDIREDEWSSINNLEELYDFLDWRGKPMYGEVDENGLMTDEWWDCWEVKLGLEDEQAEVLTAEAVEIDCQELSGEEIFGEIATRLYAKYPSLFE